MTPARDARDAMTSRTGTFLCARAHEGLSRNARHSVTRVTDRRFLAHPRVLEACRLFDAEVVAARRVSPVQAMLPGLEDGA